MKDKNSNTIVLTGNDAVEFLKVIDEPSEPNENLKRLMSERPYISTADVQSNIEFIPQMYQVIADEKELHWFFDHVIRKPAVNESYSAVFVCRHKKLTDEEKKTLGLTRKESEFLATQAFRRKTFKDALYQDEENNWLFERFLQTLKRFNVDKGAYVTGTGEPLPEKTLAVIFYVNPCDDIKVIREFVTQYMDVNQAIAKAMLGGKTTIDNLQSYQWFGRADTNIKHLKANCKGTKYWMDFDIDVPKWFKEKSFERAASLKDYCDEETLKEFRAGKITCPMVPPTIEDSYYKLLKDTFKFHYGQGNYIIIDTSGGYHILVKTSAIKGNPHRVCEEVEQIYKQGVVDGNEEYLDEKGNCKFECIVNDSQIPGIPLPGTYQYGRPVTVLNKDDFNQLVKIYSNEHHMWWKPDYCGYTSKREEAGVFDLKEATKRYPEITWNTDDEDYFVKLSKEDFQ